jgi:4a-hydroxytetrahydrobiopterin dehydratase
MTAMTRLTGQQVAGEALEGWANLVDGLQTRIRTKDFATGLQIVNAIGAAAEEMNHHPDLDLRYGRVDVRLSSHDAHGITERDIRLARTISTIAADAGATLEITGVARFELGLDSPDHPGIVPFWRTVLAMDAPDAEANDIADADGALPLIWVQNSGREEPRQRWHPDLWIDPSLVQARIAAAIAAGGTLISDEAAPRFWVLADPEGNKVCLCTWRDRD